MKTNSNILVVEDDKIAQMAIKYLIKEIENSVDVADTGKKAIELLKKNEYDLIFMDIGLPDINGIEVAQLIRTELKKVMPIIALTAHNDKNKRNICIQKGMNDFIEKPITKEKILIIIKKYLGLL